MKDLAWPMEFFEEKSVLRVLENFHLRIFGSIAMIGHDRHCFLFILIDRVDRLIVPDGRHPPGNN